MSTNAQSAQSAVFNAIDANHDGQISRSEFNAAMAGGVRFQGQTQAVGQVMYGAPQYAVQPGFPVQSFQAGMLAEPVAGMAQTVQSVQYAAPPTVTVAAPARPVGVAAGLRLTVVSARDLRDADWLPLGGKSDPYVVVEIVGKPHAQFKTQVMNSTKDPVWNYTHEFHQYTAGDALKFSVYDSDPLKSDDLLGTATLACEQFYPMGLAGELMLDNAGKNVQSFLTINIDQCAAAASTVTYAAPQTISTQVLQAPAVYMTAPEVQQAVTYAAPPVATSMQMMAEPISAPAVALQTVSMPPTTVQAAPVYLQSQQQVAPVTYAAPPVEAAAMLPPTTVVAAPQYIETQVREVEVPQIVQQERVVEVPVPQVREVIKHVHVPQVQEVVREVHVPQVQTVEKVVEVPQLQTVEKIVHVPQIVTQEMIRHVHVPQTQEIVKEVHVPQVQTVEKIVEVPQIQQVERVVEVPQIVTQEMVKHVPVVTQQEVVREVKKVSVETVEREVHVPQVQIVEKTVEIPEVQVREIVKHVHVPQVQEVVREVRVPQVQEVVREVHVPQVQTVERTVEIPTLPATTVVAPAVRAAAPLQTMTEPIMAPAMHTYAAPPMQTLAPTVTVAPTVRSVQMLPPTTVVAPSVRTVAAGAVGQAVVGMAAGLKLTVVSACDLRDADWLPLGGKSDPYVVVEIVGKPHAQFKTPVINSTKDPVWNSTHQFHQYSAGDALKFSVYDSDPMKSDDLLGTATLACEQFYPMGLAGELKLDNAGKNVEAFLTINIEQCAATPAPMTTFTNQMPMQMPMEPVAGGYQVVQQGQSMFDIIDRNHDGVISRSEFNAVVQ